MLRQFYRDVFGWELYPYSEVYTGIETSSHTHDEATGATSYSGEDAFLNDGAMVGASGGQAAWKFPGQHHWRSFEPGIPGGMAQGDAAVSVYLQANDIDVALEAVERHGGTVVRRAEEVAPNVVIAAFADPAGNEIGLSRVPTVETQAQLASRIVDISIA